MPSAETDVLLKRALALLDKSQFEGALPVLEKALELDPQSDHAWWCKGCALSALGRHAEAANTYLHLSKLAPGQPAVWFNLGNSLQALDKFTEAISCFDLATQ